jgi:hypothetical protein
LNLPEMYQIQMVGAWYLILILYSAMNDKSEKVFLRYRSIEANIGPIFWQ